MRRHAAVPRHAGIYVSQTKGGDVYEVAFKDRDNKRHFKAVGTLKEALVEQARINHKLHRGEKAHFETMMFGAVAEEWAEARLDHLSPGTQTRYKYVLERHLIPKFGTRRIRSISTDDIANYLAKVKRLDGGAMSGAGKEGVYVVLHAVMKYAANSRRGYIPVNPCDSLEAGERPQAGESPHRIITEQEAKAILYWATDRLKPVFLTAIFAGLRAGELMGLRWDDIDFDRNIIFVQRQITQGVVGPTKGREVREVELVAQLRPVLFDLPSRFQGGYVFTEKYGVYAEDFRTARELAGIEKKDKALTLHTCRHTFASAMLRSGDVAWVSKSIGHKDSKVTLDTYAHEIKRDNRNEEATMLLKEALGDLG